MFHVELFCLDSPTFAPFCCICTFTIANSDDIYIYIYIHTHTHTHDVVSVVSIYSVDLSIMMPNHLLHSTIEK